VAKLGRPSLYTPKLAAEICELLSGGQSLNSICKMDGKPNISSVMLWLSKYQDFSEKYARARQSWADAEFDRMMEIADTPQLGTKTREDADGGVEITTGDMIDHRRLQVDVRKWALARMSPKKYGDRQAVEHSGPDGAKLVIEVEHVGRK
jgi:hypothetical protein